MADNEFENRTVELTAARSAEVSEREKTQELDQEIDKLLKTRVIDAKIEELRKTIVTLEARISELQDAKPF